MQLKHQQVTIRSPRDVAANSRISPAPPRMTRLFTRLQKGETRNMQESCLAATWFGDVGSLDEAVLFQQTATTRPRLVFMPSGLINMSPSMPEADARQGRPISRTSLLPIIMATHGNRPSSCCCCGGVLTVHTRSSHFTPPTLCLRADETRSAPGPQIPPPGRLF